MQENKSTQILPKKSNSSFYISIIFLGGMIVLSAIGFIQNIFLQDAIENEKLKIAEQKSKIAELSLDKNVIIAKIIRSNTVRPSIDLGGIVRDFYDAASRANVRLKGFNITNDIISTTLIATTPNITVHPDAASTIIKMMQEYQKSQNGRFTLEPITSISGDTKNRTTQIQFRVVPTKK